MQISIIVPTLNEAANLPLLLPRIAASMADRAYEVLIVDDDSADGTPAVCERLAMEFPLRLIIRRPPRDGLSGAVLQGMRDACGDTFVVMDADLQHPPERLPALLDALNGGADFVIGSRYVTGASTKEQWGVVRRLNSRVATLLARPFAGRVHDPMSGFFSLRRSTYENAERLTPLGYKIGLELMCKCRVQRPVEVPIDFDLRAAGESKLTLTQQFKYLEHLSRLYDYTFPRLSPLVKFTIAVGVAWFVAAIAFVVLISVYRSPVGQAMAAIASYPVAVATTAIFHFRYVRTQAEFLRTRHPWRDFWIASAVEWGACAIVVAWAAWRLDAPSPWELFVLGYAAAMVGRYVCRKELLLDLRGLHAEPRAEEMTARR
ncbi:MAG TPA: polyprenol monophosphomannose synthase [Tepidisphaeraceae bacterium]|nr:polyprenol monophosphomannose synthase [Tepidisphaeraceae bacterium]